MEKNGNMTKDVEKKITRVLFCGHQFPGSHLYTTEYLQNHSFIKVPLYCSSFNFYIFSVFSHFDILSFVEEDK
jgi:hypothetical protein